MEEQSDEGSINTRRPSTKGQFSRHIQTLIKQLGFLKCKHMIHNLIVTTSHGCKGIPIDRTHQSGIVGYQRNVLRDVLIHSLLVTVITVLFPSLCVYFTGQRNNLNMQYTQSHAWGFVQENHHHQQQQQQNHQLRPLTNCYMPSPKFMSPPPYTGYLQEHQQFQKNRNTPTQLLPQQNYHPAPRQSPFTANLNGTGNEVQENMGINYVYSNSGKTFQYGVMPTSTAGRGFTQQSTRQHQQYTSSTTNILTTTMNR